MERFKVSQVAKFLGITPTAVYRKFKTSSEVIQNHVHKEKGVTYLDAEGMEILKEAMQKAYPANEESCRNEPVQNLVETLQKELDRKQGIIESLIAQQEEARKRTDTILMKLTTDISTLQKCLEYRKPEPIHQPAETITRMNPQKEKPPARSAPTTQSQVAELSLWESVQITMNNMSGFLFGRG